MLRDIPQYYTYIQVVWGRESIWEAVVVVTLITSHRDAEKGVETSFIPESTRGRLIGVTIEQDRRYTRIQWTGGTKQTEETYGEQMVNWLNAMSLIH